MKKTQASQTMSYLTLYFFMLLYIHHPTANADRFASSTNLSELIISACKTTLYPNLCTKCLSRYSFTIQPTNTQLAQAAIQISLSRARSASLFISNLYEQRASPSLIIKYQAMRDCIGNMDDSVHQLTNSLRELGRLTQVDSTVARAKEEGFNWHMSNVVTWISTALTDDTICLVGMSRSFMDGDIKNAIKRRVNNAAHVTSVALALVDHVSERQRSVAPFTTP